MDQIPEQAELPRIEIPRVTRNSVLTDLTNCLKEYGQEIVPESVTTIWNKKNEMFDNLPDGEREKLPFHDEEHTNKAVSLVSKALIGAKKQGVNLKPKQAELLIVGAIGHDLGYIKEEDGKLIVDHTQDLGGHEERSKTKVAEIMEGKLTPDEITQVQSHINWTKLGERPEGKTITEEAGLILRYGDLLAGGISAETKERYDEMIKGLWHEFELSGVDIYESLDHLRAQISKDGGFFFEFVNQQIGDFLGLLDGYEGEKKTAYLRAVVTANINYAKQNREEVGSEK